MRVLLNTKTKQQSRELVQLALPILLTQIAQAGYGLVDTIMAGQVSADDLAIVSVGAGLWLPVFLFMIGLLFATTPLLGELIGQKARAHIPYMTQQSLWFAMFIGILASVILYLVPFSFNLFDIPKQLQPNTALYLQSVAFGFTAIAMSTTLRCYTESLNYPMTMTIISIIGVLLDIPFNYIFIHGKLGMPALGGAGCGVATAIVMWLTFFMLTAYLSFSKKYDGIRFYESFAKPHLPTIKKIATLGFPIGISIFFEASLFSIAAVVLSPLGSITVAAHQVALSVTSQLFMIPMSLALALTILISRYYGKKDWHALKNMQRIGFASGTLTALFGMSVILSSRHYITDLYTNDIAVMTLAADLLIFAAMYQIVDAWQVTAAGVLRGVQDTAMPMLITFISYWCVALPLGIYLSRFAGFGAKGFWSSLVVGLSLAAFLLALRIKQQNRHIPD